MRTPDGKAVALSPSLVGRAPAPPQWKITVLNSGSSFASVPSSTSSTSEPPPKICGFQSERGAFGRHAAGDHLLQAAEHDVGQHLADGVARGDRPRPLHVEHAAFRRADGDRCERAGIVRHLGRHQAFDAERGVGEAVVVDDVDAVARRRRGAVEIDVDAVVRRSSGPH